MEKTERTAELPPREDVFEETAREGTRQKSVVIVGASSGIGYETALRLLGKGYSVSNISRTPCNLDRIRNYRADVSAGESLAKAIGEAAAAEGGELYALVYCAGFSMAAPVEHAEEKDYRYLFDVNYFGAVRAVQCCRAFYEGARRQNRTRQFDGRSFPRRVRQFLQQFQSRGRYARKERCARA